jgi:hypothetical protein
VFLLSYTATAAAAPAVAPSACGILDLNLWAAAIARQVSSNVLKSIVGGMADLQSIVGSPALAAALAAMGTNKQRMDSK